MDGVLPIDSPMTTMASQAQTRRMPLGMNFPSDNESDFLPPVGSRRRFDSSSAGYQQVGPFREIETLSSSSSTSKIGLLQNAAESLTLQDIEALRPQLFDRPIGNLENHLVFM